MQARHRLTEILLSVWLLVCLIGAAPAAIAQEPTAWTLPAAEWSRPRNGAAVLAMAPVADAVRAWQVADEAGGTPRLLLVHAGGEEGSLWAAELRDWLVALGMPPDALELVPGGQPADELEIRLEIHP